MRSLFIQFFTSRKTMIIVCFLLLTSFIPMYQAKLERGGENVRVYHEEYTIKEKTSKLTVYYVSSCTKTCKKFWVGCWEHKTVCRNIRRTRWVEVPKTVSKLRPVLTCKNGWRQVNSNSRGCTKALCFGCYHGGRCKTPYTCTCNAGWTGSRCRSDINECGHTDHRNPCPFKAYCENLPGSYNCKCPNGFYLRDTQDGEKCEDIDECLLERDNCKHPSTCNNTQGSYKCDCPKGYYLDVDERTCKDINECSSYESLCDHKEHCRNTVGGYVCSCRKGYYLADDKHTCKDINECTNKSVCEQHCLNYPGGYSCSCDDGFRGSGNGQRCYDVDECTEGTSGCTHNCKNTLGSFQCFCNSGYFLSWDKKSCVDIDECKTNQHGCSHICNNTFGGYKCSCRKGFDLSKDEKKCTGRSCFPILTPRDGNMSCSGHITEDTCQFSCPSGFELIGSRSRTCTAGKIWSGVETDCKRLYCPPPPEPTNGFIYFPCKTHVHSRCLAGCDNGYYINGTAELRCTSSQSWKPDNIICNERKLCEPNPCQHDGTCSTGNFNQFHCNCSQTGYEGKLCEVGMVDIPVYPILGAQTPSKHFRFKVSPPEDYLVLTPISAGVDFHPSKLVFRRNNATTQSMMLAAKRSGLHSVRYYLSGPSSKNFRPPESTTVFVKSSSSSSKNISGYNSTLKPIFPIGCYRIRLDNCPRSGKPIIASSTTPWRMIGSLATTSGVVSLSNTVSIIPYSLVGASFDNVQQLSTKKICVKNIKDTPDTELLIKRGVLTAKFLKGLRRSLPKWLDIQQRIITDVLEPEAFIQTGLQASYMSGKQLRQEDVLEGQPIIKDSYYYLVPLAHLDAFVRDDVLSFGSHNFHAKLSVAVDLCTAPPSNVIIRPSPQDTELIKNLPLLQRLKQSDWNTEILSVQFSKRKTINGGNIRFPYTNVLTKVNNVFANGNMAIFGSFSKLGNIGEFAKYSVNFQGTMVMNVENIDNAMDYSFNRTWKADLLGNIQLELRLIVHDKDTKILMEIQKTKASAYFSGNDGDECFNENKHSLTGFALKGLPEENLFSHTELNQFVEIDTSTNISCFLNVALLSKKQYNRSKVSNGIAMDFRGNLKFAALRFDNLDIKMQIKHPKCINTLHAMLHTNSVAELNGDFHNLRGKKLGIFEIPVGFNINLRLLLDPSKKSKSNGSFHAIANILGFQENVMVNLSSKGLRFIALGKIYGLFNAFVTFESSLESWERQRYFASGTFEDMGTEHTLKTSLENELKKHISDISKRAKSRLELSKRTEERAIKRLKAVQSTHNQMLNKMKLYTKKYEQTVRELTLAKKNLNGFKALVQNSSDYVNARRKKLDKLCQKKQCLNICKRGAVLKNDYYDEITSIKNYCFDTCYHIMKERKGPKFVSATCINQRCKTSHGTPHWLLSAAAAIVFPVVGGFLRGRGRWDCKMEQETCQKPNFDYDYKSNPYVCRQPCREKQIINTDISEVYITMPCGITGEDIFCKMEKVRCVKTRKLAIEEVLKNSAEALSILRDLANAENKVSICEIKSQKAEHKLQSVRHFVNSSKYTMQNIEKAHSRIVKAGRKRIEILEQLLKLSELLDEGQQSFVLFKIERIDFNVEVSAARETTLLPLYITYTLNRTQGILSTVLDFTNLNTSLRSIAKEILSANVGDSPYESRRKRSVDTPSVDKKVHTLQKRYRLCSEFRNRQQIIHDVIMTLYKRASDMQQANQSVSKSVKSLLSGMKNSSQIDINITIASEFGLDVHNDAFFNAIETDPVIMEVKGLQQNVINEEYEQIRSTTKSLFENWLASMETIFENVSKECSGFEDCFKQNIDRLLEISFDSEPQQEMNVRDHIKTTWKLFSKLTEEDDMTVDDMVNSSLKILGVVSRMISNTKICARAPNITVHPIPYKELRKNMVLVLVCNATGDFVVYQWKFNGDVLKNQSMNVLRIENTTPLNSGSYVCEAFNHIDKVESSPAVIVIGSPPTIILQPKPRAFLISSNYDSIVCQAEKSERNTSYQWWFKSLKSDQFVAIEHGVFSYLNFVPVRIKHEGWYYCNISNMFGYTVSKTSFVKVLTYSLPVPATSLSFTVTREYHAANTSRPFAPAVSQQDILQKYIRSSYPFVSNNSNIHQAEKIKELFPVRCEITERDNHVNNDIEICDWELTIVGRSVISTIAAIRIKPEAQEKELKKALLDLKRLAEELEYVTNSGKMSFVHGNGKYSLRQGSMVVKEFTLLCSPGQVLVNTIYKCVNCPPGFYGKLKEGTPFCELCPIGFFQERPGMTLCNKCPKGFTTTATGSYDISQCNDERKFFLGFKLVNDHDGNVLVNMTIASQSQIRLVGPNKHILICRGWKTEKSVLLSAIELSTKKNLYINGQSEIRLSAKMNSSSLDVFYIDDYKAEKSHTSATFVLVSRYHNPVRILVTVNSRTRTFVLTAKTHAWFLADQISQSLAILRKEKWQLRAVDLKTKKSLLISEQTTFDVFPGRKVFSFSSMLYVYDADPTNKNFIKSEAVSRKIP